MNFESSAALLFVVLLSFLLFKHRKRIELQGAFPVFYMALFRTKWGLKSMDRLGSYKTFWRTASPAIITLGFIGMIVITGELILSAHALLTAPEAPSGIGIVQPFVPGVKGTVFVPFFYFIISIFIIATIHEFSHGVLARAWNLKVKSSGFAALGIGLPIIPAAFVEPDEKEVDKASTKAQLAMFAAGPASNIILAALVLLVMTTLLPPIANALYTSGGVEIDSLQEGFPAIESPLQPGDVIMQINNMTVTNFSTFNASLSNHQPNDKVIIKTQNNSFPLTLGEKDNRSYMGVMIKPHLITRPEQQYLQPLPNFIIWFAGLLNWLFMLNLGIGLFNLIPLGPIDGGRMVLATSRYFLGEKRGVAIWSKISLCTLIILVGNLVLSFVR